MAIQSSPLIKLKHLGEKKNFSRGRKPLTDDKIQLHGFLTAACSEYVLERSYFFTLLRKIG